MIYLSIHKALDLPVITLNVTYLVKYKAQDLPGIILNMMFQNTYRAQDLPRIILNMTYLLKYTAQDLPGIILNMIFQNVYRAQDLPRIILNDMYPQGIFVCIFLYLALLRSRGRPSACLARSAARIRIATRMARIFIDLLSKFFFIHFSGTIFNISLQ